MTAEDFSFCPYCGAKLKTGDLVCPHCHRRLPVAQTEPKQPSINRMANNPFREGMARYHEKTKSSAKAHHQSFWRKLFFRSK